ncbi:Probable sensor-like histidine kinase YehU [Turicibacter sanguinis]|nr:Probable sensor-like histidine kinase YehU [Turicibacter sanguinis]
MKRYNTIFIRILSITLPSFLVLSLIISISCIKISENVLLKEVVEIANRNLIQVKNSLLEYNTEIAVAISKISNSKEFKAYITADNPSSSEQLNLVLEIGRYMDTYREYLTPQDSYFMIAGAEGNESRYYSSNTSKWGSAPTDFIDRFLMVDGHLITGTNYHIDKELFKGASPFENNIFVTKSLIDAQKNFYGYVVLVLDEKYIASIYEDYITSGMTISVISNTGDILSSSDKERLFTANEELINLIKDHSEELSDTDTVKVIKNDKETILALYLPFYDAYLVEEINPLIVFSSLHSIADKIIFIILVTLLIVGFVAFIATRNITKPLRYLSERMLFTVTHDFRGQMIEPQGSNELILITQAYNTMLNDIKEHVKNLVSEQEERRKAELNALQMQINPHFLYNTLTSIKYLAKQQRLDEVDETIHSLISILQNVIGKTDSMTTVRDEIENLGYFIYINQVRYGNGIKVDYQIARDCYDLMMPKLIIQPFIENAFFHGFVGTDVGNITVFINSDEELLMIEVIDNGVGMANSETTINEKKYHFSGIGINNVHERIQLLYGEEYGIEVYSEVGEGTSIIIKLPKIEPMT